MRFAGRTRPSAVAWLLCLAVVFSMAVPAGAGVDSFFDSQWALDQIRAPEAWPRATGRGVVIGVVDTGVDPTHPDLAGKVLATADCIGGPCREGAGDDAHGHGTLVAGIAAAVTDNDRGIAGVAPEARLVVARAIGGNGEGQVADIDRAIRWVVAQGAQVVNLSIGDPNVLAVTLLGTPLRPAVEYAWSQGAIPVLASGNQSTGLVDLGSSNYGDLDAVVVGATTRAGSVADYSSPLGTAKWGLVAPGGSGTGDGDDVISTYTRGEYALTSGTSMATPHVSGALALLLSQGLSAQAAVDTLMATLDRSRPCGLGCKGRLDVAAAVAAVPVRPSSTLPRATTTVPQATTSSVPVTTTEPATTTTEADIPADVPPVTIDRRRDLAVPVTPEGSTSRALPVALAVSLGSAAWLGVGYVGLRRLRGVA